MIKKYWGWTIAKFVNFALVQGEDKVLVKSKSFITQHSQNQNDLQFAHNKHETLA